MILDRALQFLARDKLSVFLFHRVPVAADSLLPKDLDLAAFERLIDHLRSAYEVLPLSEAANCLERRSFRRATACITFDDGYADWVGGVVPLLERKSLPATFFITTGQFHGRPMWHERLSNVIRRAQGEILDTSKFRLPPLRIGSLEEKQSALQQIEFHFKYLPVTIRDDFLDRLEAQTGVDATEVGCFTEEHLRQISNRGFDIGSHTIDHPILSLCDERRAIEEIAATREVLEGITGSRVASFAYPNGRPCVDFSHRHIAMVRSAGYQCAVTTQGGAATYDTSRFQIPRFTPWGPSPGLMSFQLIRNLVAKPEYIREQS